MAALAISSDMSAAELRAPARRVCSPHAASRASAIAHALKGTASPPTRARTWPADLGPLQQALSPSEAQQGAAPDERVAA